MYGNTGLTTANMKITGAMIPPIRATAEQYPIPTFLKIVNEFFSKFLGANENPKYSTSSQLEIIQQCRHKCHHNHQLRRICLAEGKQLMTY